MIYCQWSFIIDNIITSHHSKPFPLILHLMIYYYNNGFTIKLLIIIIDYWKNHLNHLNKSLLVISITDGYH